MSNEAHLQSSPSNRWSAYQSELYMSRKAPFLGTVNLLELEKLAGEALKDQPEAFGYVHGSAGNNGTYSANRQSLEEFKIIPRMLRDVSKRSTETELFGEKYDSPVLLAPIGVQGLWHPDAEIGSARAAAKLGVPFVMSTASTRSMEDLTEHVGKGPRFYQLYWPRTNEVTLSLLGRAKQCGFRGLFVTLDTFVLGWRPLDLATSYMPFAHGVGIQQGASDPVFMKRQGKEITHKRPDFPYDHKGMDKRIQDGDAEALAAAKLGIDWLKETNSGMFRSWEDLKFLRDNWDGPIILKGIQSVEDAELAIKHNMDGIVVSNHGGRQADGAIGSLSALDEICQSKVIQDAQAVKKFTILFDSGIRSGSDIIKALALGAEGVLLGRPFVYGLAVGGEHGVDAVIKAILADLEVTMACIGVKNIQDIIGNRSLLRRPGNV